MIKRIIPIIMVLCLAIAAVGCAGTTGETGPEGTEGAASTAAASEEGTVPASSGDSQASDTDGEETAAEQTTAGEPEKARQVIRVASGEFGGNFTGVFSESDGDQAVAQLIQPTLIMSDRQGSVIRDSSSKTVAFNGTEYDYDSVVSVSDTYDEESNTTVFTIRVRDGAVFSDGSPISADDLIFTYYVLCDPSYDGPYKVQDQNIYGVRAYQLNNTAAPGIDISSADISAALGNPDEGLKELIVNEIIRPVLEEERAWCEENWQNYVERGYGDSAEEFFVTLYTSTLNSNYSAGEKSFDEVIEDTVELFGMNYKTLAKNYKNDINYFDEKVKNLTKNYIYDQKVNQAGGEEMPRISGIKKVDGKEITISVMGRSSAAVMSVCDIPLLSLDYYGNGDYDYENDSFGVKRGELDSIKALSGQPFGYGPYLYVGSDAASVTLIPNPYYVGYMPEDADLKLVYAGTEGGLSAVTAEKADIAFTALGEDELTAIQTTNGCLGLSGEVLTAVAIPDDTYYYYGFNANRVNVNDGILTEASLHMRRAIELAFMAKINTATFYGVKLDQPASSNFLGATAEGARGCLDILTKQLDGIERAEDGLSFLDMARAELTAAGYTLGEDGRISHLPEGGKMEFTLWVPPYLSGDNEMTRLTAEIKSSVEELGFVLNLRESEDIDEFVSALKDGKADMWCASRDISSCVRPAAYYTSDGTSNYYSLSDQELDGLFSELNTALMSDSDAAAEIYGKIYNRLMTDAVELPVYQKQKAVVYNTEKIYISPDAGLTEYFGLLDDTSLIRLAANVPVEERVTPEVETSPEPVTEETVVETTAAETGTAVEETAGTVTDSSAAESADETENADTPSEVTGTTESESAATGETGAEAGDENVADTAQEDTTAENN